MDCFNCVHPDCINNVFPTKKEEREIMSGANVIGITIGGKKTEDMKEYRRRYYQQNRERLLNQSKAAYHKRKKKEANSGDSKKEGPSM